MVPTNYQAAHTVPQRTSTSLNITHSTQLANHTHPVFNGTGTYDSKPTNTFNVDTSSPGEMLTSGCPIGLDLVNKKIAANNDLAKLKVNNNQSDDDKIDVFTLICLRDVNHRTYTDARNYIGSIIYNGFFDNYKHNQKTEVKRS